MSPAHPDAELDLLPARLSKEELIQNMDRVDREITMVEQQISKLKKKQVRGCSPKGSRYPLSCVLPYSPFQLRGSGSAGATRVTCVCAPCHDVRWLLRCQSADGNCKRRELWKPGLWAPLHVRVP